MSDLCNLLNPENDRKKQIRVVLGMKRRVSESTSEEHSPTEFRPEEMHVIEDKTSKTSLRDSEDLSLYDHESHPDCPDTLACLPDTDGRPQHTLPVILRCAILGSPRKRLTIREIYASMEAKYPYYKTAGPTWKQSVRHHLSLNRLFERQPRPVTDPGFGSYWTVNLSAPPGTKRPRKRGRSTKETNPETTPPRVKRRGRPRKPSSSTARHLTPTLSSHEEDEEEKLSLEDDCGMNISDDEYESEEELRPYDRRHSLTGLTAYAPSRPPQTFSLPPFSTLDKSPSLLIEHYQMEIESLRRQSAEAVSVSLRLSEQLAQAQAEATRSRAALMDVEDILERESRKRREAERVADEEVKRRRAAEEAMRMMVISDPSRASRSEPPRTRAT